MRPWWTRIALLALVAVAGGVAAYIVPTLEVGPGRNVFSQAQLAFLRHALQTDGIVALSGLPGLGEARREGLAALGRCYQAGALNPEKSLTVTLADGTKRVTLAFDENAPLDNTGFGCEDLDRAVQALRKIMDEASMHFAKALDDALLVKEEQPLFIAVNNADRSSYMDFSSVIEHGEHLDHFHVYEKRIPELTEVKVPNDAALEMHTDQGLFVAIIPSLTLQNGKVVDVQDGFEVNLAGHRGPTQITMPNHGDVVFVMLGDGMQGWIASRAMKTSVRPTPHRLVIPQQQHGLARAWFGRMFFPPKDAFIEKQRVVFSDFRMQSIQHGANQPKDISFGGCSSRRHILRDLTETACGADQIYCWMACRSTAELSCSGDETIQCVNQATSEIWTNEAEHCFDCAAKCWAPPRDNTTDPDADGGSNHGGVQKVNSTSASSVCNTRLYPTNMYMDGFTGVGPNVACLIFLFKSWVLDTPVKYAFGSIGAFAIGFVIEFIVLLRREVKHPRKARIWVAQCLPDARSETAQTVLLGTLYCIQLVLAYFAMLLAMSFSAVIFCMVMIGLTTGHVMLNLRTTLPGGNEACCAASDELDTPDATLGGKPGQNLDSPTHQCCAVDNGKSDDESRTPTMSMV